MPPSLPAPSTANFLSESSRDMVNALPNGEAVIFDVEIWSTEIQFLARVHELCFRCGAQSFAPKVRCRDANFVARPARQTRALQLRNVRRRCLFRVEIGVTRRQYQIGDRL